MNCLGAYRESGILPGEEMILSISTTSVIYVNNAPSGKQVREFASSYEVSTGDDEAMFRTHILKIYNFQDGFSREARHQNKKDTLKECPFRFGDPYGNRTHVFSVRG